MTILYEANIDSLDAKFALRTIDDNKDHEMIWQWWHAPHVKGNWSVDVRLQSIRPDRDYTIEDLHTYLRDMPQTDEAVIGMLNGAPLGYVEGCRIGTSPWANHPELDADDRVFHVMIGDVENISRGFGKHLGPHIIRWQLLAHAEAQRVVSDPATNNSRAINTVTKFDGAVQKENVKLDHKDAAFIVFHRNQILKTTQTDRVRNR